MGNYYNEINRIIEKIALKLFIIEKQKIEIEASEEAVTLFDIALLKTVGDHGEVTVELLEEAMGLSKSMLSVQINRNHMMGFLERERSSADGRVLKYNLSLKGRSLYEAINRKEEAFIGEALSHITIHEEKAVLKFLSKLNQMIGSKGKK